MSMKVYMTPPDEVGKCLMCGNLNPLENNMVNSLPQFQDNKMFVDHKCTNDECQFEWTDWYTYENSTYIDTIFGDEDYYNRIHIGDGG